MQLLIPVNVHSQTHAHVIVKCKVLVPLEAFRNAFYDVLMQGLTFERSNTNCSPTVILKSDVGKRFF